MKNLSLIASALAMLGLTACEKGLVDGVHPRFLFKNEELDNNRNHPVADVKEKE